MTVLRNATFNDHHAHGRHHGHDRHRRRSVCGFFADWISLFLRKLNLVGSRCPLDPPIIDVGHGHDTLSTHTPVAGDGIVFIVSQIVIGQHYRTSNDGLILLDDPVVVRIVV